MKNKAELEKLEKELAKYMRKHDQIENPICYTHNCPICNKMKEIDEKIKAIKALKREK